MIEKRYCIDCGADITARRRTAVRCIDCGIRVHHEQSKRYTEQNKEKRRERDARKAEAKRQQKLAELAAHHTHRMTLSQCAREAKKRGMTYGQYVAMTGK